MRPYKEEHFAALDIREVPEFLSVLDENSADLHFQTRLAIKFMMLTFVRTSEMIRARWEEFDLDEGLWLNCSEHWSFVSK